MVDHWRKRIRRNPDWIGERLRQVEQILRASQGDAYAQQSLGSCLRQFHDKLGFKAKGSLAAGGLCAGAIFRTQAFIETTERVGSKVDQSVHIEHTFPIRQLTIEITKRPFKEYSATLVWLLTHSVATALHEHEKPYLKGRSSTSDALDPTSPKYLKPFARYERLHKADGIVWNVFDRVRVDPEVFTFQHHLDLIVRLLEEAGATPRMVSSIRNSGRDLGSNPGAPK